jgi:ABC-type maltose transport system permease subunit
MPCRLAPPLRIAALVITYPGLVIPFCAWVLWTYFNRLPGDFVDLARAEGATPMQVLRYALLPLSRPALLRWASSPWRSYSTTTFAEIMLGAAPVPCSAASS